VKEKEIPGLLFFVLPCLLLVGPVLGEGETNLVLHRPYEYWPEPTYHHTGDEGDARQLTDGHSDTSSWSLWMQKSAVCWIAGVNVPVVIRFDLGREATMTELHFHTAGGIHAGVVEAGLQVFVSLDDETYVLAGELPAPPPKAGGGYYPITLRVPLDLNDTRARYVAVAAMAPAPHYSIVVDEIELKGIVPARPGSSLPIQTGLSAGGAKGLQKQLAGGNRAVSLASSLTLPVRRHIAHWPAPQREAQREELETFVQAVRAQSDRYEQLRTQFTEQHRLRAREVYGADTLVWEVVPDEQFTVLSLPGTPAPDAGGTIHTVVNALEATALGASNLTDQDLPLRISFRGGGEGAPRMAVRVGRFFVTSNARYVPDALLANDCPQVIPSGESKLIWLEAESSGARPGLYDYDVSVGVGDRPHLVPLKVQVHDVVLSLETPLSTGNWSYLDTGEEPILKDVRDAMLSHRITVAYGSSGAYSFPAKNPEGEVIRPVRPDFRKLDKFLAFHKDFDQVGIILFFNHHAERPHYDWFGRSEWMSDEFKDVFREWLVPMIERIKGSGRDYDAFNIQAFDETLDENVEHLCRLIHSIDPNVRVTITIPQATRDATRDLVAAGMNVFIYHAPRIEYDNAPDGFPVLSSGGRELWFYGAADASFGTGKERDPLGYYRYLHWTAFRHGATGVNFWNMLTNNGGSPVWDEEMVGQDYWPMVYPVGGAYTRPPEDVRTAETVLPSRRWQYTRMGIEDYMLLKMAREKIESLGEAGETYQKQLDEIVKTVLTTRAKDRGLFRAKRRELVELVENLTMQ
jgi:hypothetical protein